MLNIVIRRTEYWEGSWCPEETHCHTDSSERPWAHAGVKKKDLETWGGLLLRKFLEKLSAFAGVKNFPKSK